MARTLAAFVAALAAALTLAYLPARAEPQIGASYVGAGQPLNIVPAHRQVRKPAVEQSAAAKTGQQTTAQHTAPQHVAPQHVAPQHLAHRRVVQTAGTASPGNDGRAVIRGQDTSSLLAMLPWWRADPMETIRYLDRETGSGVLATAEAWLGVPIAESHAAATGQAVQRGSSENTSDVDHETNVAYANADELNAMDLLAVAVTAPRKADASWLHALLAMLGGALAAASTARYLFG
jgi:hypothetical protein